jgi:hypothetical protein
MREPAGREGPPLIPCAASRSGRRGLRPTWRTAAQLRRGHKVRGNQRRRAWEGSHRPHRISLHQLIARWFVLFFGLFLDRFSRRRRQGAAERAPRSNRCRFATNTARDIHERFNLAQSRFSRARVLCLARRCRSSGSGWRRTLAYRSRVRRSRASPRMNAGHHELSRLVGENGDAYQSQWLRQFLMPPLIMHLPGRRCRPPGAISNSGEVCFTNRPSNVSKQRVGSAKLGTCLIQLRRHEDQREQLFPFAGTKKPLTRNMYLCILYVLGSLQKRRSLAICLITAALPDRVSEFVRT